MRERAIRRVAEAIEEQNGDRRGVVGRIARQLGVGTESLRTWVLQHEIDAGSRPALPPRSRRGSGSSRRRTGSSFPWHCSPL